jgi:pSer/pThr/pTyr-binding forkhead associated (FHA) protein
MEKLVVINDDGVTQEFPLNQRIISLGRDRSNDVCLADKSVSRHHASVVKIFAEYFLQDEKSTNGTRLNGIEIRKHILRNGDEIDIGKYRLRYQGDADDRADEDLDKTVVIAPAAKHDQQHPKTEQNIQRPAVPSSKNHARIRFLSGLAQGELQTIDRAFFTIGKPGGDLVLINRRHTGYFLLKMGGDAPPSVNGEAVRAGGVKLHDGDRIQLGELNLEFIL